MKADLHIHSVYSDGELNVKELSDYAKARGLDVIAITDHDSVSACDDVLNLTSDIKIIIGTEMSALAKGEEIHILGYFYNNEVPDAIKTFLAGKQARRHDRVREIIEKLKEFYEIELTYEEIAVYADGVIGRPHIAMAIENKYNYGRDEIFEKYIGNDSKAYVPADQFEAGDAVKLLKENNALVVLAHPKFLKRNSVEEIIELGIDGIEVNYPDQDEELKNKLRMLAKQYDLIITGGSDFHGPDISNDMGFCYISDEEVESFSKKIERRSE